MLYRGSEHGFTAKDFHYRADDSLPTATLTFVKSDQGRAFGGFTSMAWQSEQYRDYPDETAFVFSLSQGTKHEQYQNKEKAMR